MEGNGGARLAGRGGNGGDERNQGTHDFRFRGGGLDQRFDVGKSLGQTFRTVPMTDGTGHTSHHGRCWLPPSLRGVYLSAYTALGDHDTSFQFKNLRAMSMPNIAACELKGCRVAHYTVEYTKYCGFFQRMTQNIEKKIRVAERISGKNGSICRGIRPEGRKGILFRQKITAET